MSPVFGVVARRHGIACLHRMPAPGKRPQSTMSILVIFNSINYLNLD